MNRVIETFEVVDCVSFLQVNLASARNISSKLTISQNIACTNFDRRYYCGLRMLPVTF